MKKSNRFLRFISLVLVHGFLLEQAAFADPDLFRPAKFDPSQKPHVSLRLPESVAAIEDAYKGSGDKTIYLIQDAHTNDSGQMNLSKTLEEIMGQEKGVKYVFTEAARGDNSLTFLRNFKTQSERQEVAASYIRKGLLHGAEYLDITSKLNFVIWGVENPELYVKALEDYKAVAKDRERFQNYLSRIQSTIKTLKPRILNPALQQFDQKYEKFQKEETTLTEYFGELTRQAEKLNISLEKFPHISILNNLQAKESEIDFKKANEEQVKAIQSLSPEDQQELIAATEENKNSPFKLTGFNHKEKKAFYALLEEKLGLAVYAKYPELAKYFQYLKIVKTLDAKELLNELKTIEKEIYDALIKTSDERSLIRASHASTLLNKLFLLTLTPEEFEDYQRLTGDFDITRLTGFLNKKIMDLKTYYDSAVFLESGYEDIVKRSESFYALTAERDAYFVEKSLEKMSQENQNSAVLITGGFHTPNLKSLLKSKNISYISITPQVLHETNQKRYESILLNQSLPQGSTLAVAGSATLMTRYIMGEPSVWPAVQQDFGGDNAALVAKRLEDATPFFATKGSRLSEKVSEGAVDSGIAVTARTVSFDELQLAIKNAAARASAFALKHRIDHLQGGYESIKITSTPVAPNQANDFSVFAAGILKAIPADQHHLKFDVHIFYNSIDVFINSDSLADSSLANGSRLGLLRLPKNTASFEGQAVNPPASSSVARAANAGGARLAAKEKLTKLKKYLHPADLRELSKRLQGIKSLNDIDGFDSDVLSALKSTLRTIVKGNPETGGSDTFQLGGKTLDYADIVTIDRAVETIIQAREELKTRKESWRQALAGSRLAVNSEILGRLEEAFKTASSLKKEVSEYMEQKGTRELSSRYAKGIDHYSLFESFQQNILVSTTIKQIQDELSRGVTVARLIELHSQLTSLISRGDRDADGAFIHKGLEVAQKQAESLEIPAQTTKLIGQLVAELRDIHTQILQLEVKATSGSRLASEADKVAAELNTPTTIDLREGEGTATISAITVSDIYKPETFSKKRFIEVEVGLTESIAIIEGKIYVNPDDMGYYDHTEVNPNSPGVWERMLENEAFKQIRDLVENHSDEKILLVRFNKNKETYLIRRNGAIYLIGDGIHGYRIQSPTHRSKSRLYIKEGDLPIRFSAKDPIFRKIPQVQRFVSSTPRGSRLAAIKPTGDLISGATVRPFHMQQAATGAEIKKEAQAFGPVNHYVAQIERLMGTGIPWQFVSDADTVKANALIRVTYAPISADQLGSRLADQISPEVITLIETRSGIRKMAVSPDGHIIATAQQDDSVRLWDSETGKELWPLDHAIQKNLITALLFSADGQTLVASSQVLTFWRSSRTEQGYISFWDVRTGKQVNYYEGDDQVSINALALSPDQILATGSSDGTVNLWDLKNAGSIWRYSDQGALDRVGAGMRGLLKTLRKADNESVASVAFSADGKTLTVKTANGTSELWNVGTGNRKADASKPEAVKTELSAAGSRLAKEPEEVAYKVKVKVKEHEEIGFSGRGNDRMHFGLTPIDLNDAATLKAIQDIFQNVYGDSFHVDKKDDLRFIVVADEADRFSFPAIKFGSDFIIFNKRLFNAVIANFGLIYVHKFPEALVLDPRVFFDYPAKISLQGDTFTITPSVSSGSRLATTAEMQHAVSQASLAAEGLLMILEKRNLARSPIAELKTAFNNLFNQGRTQKYYSLTQVRAAYQAIEKAQSHVQVYRQHEEAGIRTQAVTLEQAVQKFLSAFHDSKVTGEGSRLAIYTVADIDNLPTGVTLRVTAYGSDDKSHVYTGKRKDLTGRGTEFPMLWLTGEHEHGITIKTITNIEIVGKAHLSTDVPLDEQIAKWAHSAVIPDKSVDEVENRIIDSLSIASRAKKYLLGRARFAQAMQYALKPSAKPRKGALYSTLFFTKYKTPVREAALLLGSLIRDLDYDDTILGEEPGHPSDNIAPMLAVGEAIGAKPREVLEAIAVAYEVQIRLAEALKLRGNGWDHVNYVAIATAAGVGRLLKLNPEQLRNAISRAAMVGHARGMRQDELTDMKSGNAAVAASEGLQAALDAKMGLQGPKNAFEKKMGFNAQFLNGKDLRLHVEPFDGTAIFRSFYKRRQAEYHAQSAIELSQKLHNQLAERYGKNADGSLSDEALSKISSITLHTFEAVVTILADKSREPHDRESADHNMAYMIAATLVRGDVDERTFQHEVLTDKRVLALSKMIEIKEDPEYTKAYYDQSKRHNHNRVTIVTSDGQAPLAEDLENASGHWSRPWGIKEVSEKAHLLLDPVYDPINVDLIVSTIKLMSESNSTVAIEYLMSLFADPDEKSLITEGPELSGSRLAAKNVVTAVVNRPEGDYPTLTLTTQKSVTPIIAYNTTLLMLGLRGWVHKKILNNKLIFGGTDASKLEINLDGNKQIFDIFDQADQLAAFLTSQLVATPAGSRLAQNITGEELPDSWDVKTGKELSDKLSDMYFAYAYPNVRTTDKLVNMGPRDTWVYQRLLMIITGFENPGKDIASEVIDRLEDSIGRNEYAAYLKALSKLKNISRANGKTVLERAKKELKKTNGARLATFEEQVAEVKSLIEQDEALGLKPREVLTAEFLEQFLPKNFPKDQMPKSLEEAVVLMRGPMGHLKDYGIAKENGKLFREIIYSKNENEFIFGLGAYSPEQVQSLQDVNYYRRLQGLENQPRLAPYGSGWVLAAVKNADAQVYPDNQLYSSPSTQILAAQTITNTTFQTSVNNALEGHPRAVRDSLSLYVMDIEAPMSPMHAFNIVMQGVQAGVPAFHAEAQNPAFKVCGHGGGACGRPLEDHKAILAAMLLAGYVSGVPIVVIGRTDASHEKFNISDHPLTRPFILGHTNDGRTDMTYAEALKAGYAGEWTDRKIARGPNGYWTPDRTKDRLFRVRPGEEKVIHDMIEQAPYCHMMWSDTHGITPEERVRVAEAVHAVYPNIPLADNVSPNLPQTKLTNEQIELYKTLPGKHKYKYLFMTLGSYRNVAFNTYMFTEDIANRGPWTALKELQLKEQEAAKRGYRGNQSQVMASGRFWDMVKGLTGTSAERAFVAGSTETAQAGLNVWDKLGLHDIGLLAPVVANAVKALPSDKQKSGQDAIRKILAEAYLKQRDNREQHLDPKPIIEQLTVSGIEEAQAKPIVDYLLGVALTSHHVSVEYTKLTDEQRSKVAPFVTKALEAMGLPAQVDRKATEDKKELYLATRAQIQGVLTRIFRHPFDRSTGFLEDLQTALGFEPTVAYELFDGVSNAALGDNTTKRTIFGNSISVKEAWKSLFAGADQQKFTLLVQRAGNGPAEAVTPDMTFDKDDVLVLTPKAQTGSRLSDITVRDDAKEGELSELWGDKTLKNGTKLNVEETILWLAEQLTGDVTATINNWKVMEDKANALIDKGATPEQAYGFLAADFVAKRIDQNGNEVTATAGQIYEGGINNFLLAMGENVPVSPNRWAMNETVAASAKSKMKGLVLTGPNNDIGMMLSAFNAARSGVTSRLEDSEDASPETSRKDMWIQQLNLKRMYEGKFKDGKFFHPTKKKEYSLDVPLDEAPAAFHRLPGIHLTSPSVTVRGKRIPAFIAVMAVYMLNNYDNLHENGFDAGFYLPKTKWPMDMFLWNKALFLMEEKMGLPHGAIKAKVMHERAEFSLSQFVNMWVIQMYSLITNVGRWDQNSSFIQMFKRFDSMLFPDQRFAGMLTERMTYYTWRNAFFNILVGVTPETAKKIDPKKPVQLVELTQALAEGGMAVQLKNNPKPDDSQEIAAEKLKLNSNATADIRTDKIRERLIGLQMFVKSNGQKILLDSTRESWVATTDAEYVKAGSEVFQVELNADGSTLEEIVAPLQAYVDANVSTAMREKFIKLGILGEGGKIKPVEYSKEDLTKEKIDSSENWKRFMMPSKGDRTLQGLAQEIFFTFDYNGQQVAGLNAAAVENPLDGSGWRGILEANYTGNRLMSDHATNEGNLNGLYVTLLHGQKFTQDGKFEDLTGTYPTIEVKAGDVITPDLVYQIWLRLKAFTEKRLDNFQAKGIPVNRPVANVVMETVKRILLKTDENGEPVKNSAGHLELQPVNALPYFSKILYRLNELYRLGRLGEANNVLNAIFLKTREQLVAEGEPFALDTHDDVFNISGSRLATLDELITQAQTGDNSLKIQAVKSMADRSLYFDSANKLVDQDALNRSINAIAGLMKKTTPDDVRAEAAKALDTIQSWGVAVSIDGSENLPLISSYIPPRTANSIPDVFIPREKDSNLGARLATATSPVATNPLLTPDESQLLTAVNALRNDSAIRKALGPIFMKLAEALPYPDKDATFQKLAHSGLWSSTGFYLPMTARNFSGASLRVSQRYEVRDENSYNVNVVWARPAFMLRPARLYFKTTDDLEPNDAFRYFYVESKGGELSLFEKKSGVFAQWKKVVSETGSRLAEKSLYGSLHETADQMQIALNILLIIGSDIDKKNGSTTLHANLLAIKQNIDALLALAQADVPDYPAILKALSAVISDLETQSKNVYDNYLGHNHAGTLSRERQKYKRELAKIHSDLNEMVLSFNLIREREEFKQDFIDGLMLKLLSGSSDAERLHAAKSLAILVQPGKVKIVPSLLRALEGSQQQPEIQENIVTILNRIGPAAKDAVPALVKLTGDKNKELRKKAAYALGNILVASDEVINALITLLSDKESDVISAAASALGRFGPAHASKTLPALQSAYQKTPFNALGGDIYAAIRSVENPTIGSRLAAAAGTARLVISDLTPEVLAFAKEYAALLGANLNTAEVVDASDDDRLLDEAVNAGELVMLADGNYHANSDPDDVARSEGRTFVATRNPKHKSAKIGSEKPSTNNWRNTDELKPVVERELKASMKGKKLYVIPYLMGPAGSPYSQVGIQLTDSRYVALNMIRMTKTGRVALDYLKAQKDPNYFVRGVHSTGDLKKLAAERKANPENDKRYFASFPEERLILSYGSNYGGNALLGKKFHSLRQASFDAWKEGWLAEHMLILEIISKATGERKYIAAAFPSASGKTNLAMLVPPDDLKKHFEVRVVGDDIAWLRVDENGTLRAINPENGFFGVVPGTNQDTNPNFYNAMMKPNGKNIFTNLARNTATGEVWWEGKTKDYPANIENWVDWQGLKISDRPVDQQKNKKFPWAHPNSRATVSIANVPNASDKFNDPKGVPISAFFFGGKLDSRQPLIEQMRWTEEGVYDALNMIVQATVAAEGKEGTVRPDAMAMTPFMAYHELDYAQHWLDVMNEIQRKGGKQPTFFHVNWFRLDAKRNFLWPGFGENLRPILWALGRDARKADAAETPMGRFVPKFDDGFFKGVFAGVPDAERRARWDELFAFNEAEQRAELERQKTFMQSLADADHPIPAALLKVQEELARPFAGSRLAENPTAVTATSIENMFELALAPYKGIVKLPATQVFPTTASDSSQLQEIQRAWKNKFLRDYAAALFSLPLADYRKMREKYVGLFEGRNRALLEGFFDTKQRADFMRAIGKGDDQRPAFFTSYQSDELSPAVLTYIYDSEKIDSEKQKLIEKFPVLDENVPHERLFSELDASAKAIIGNLNLHEEFRYQVTEELKLQFYKALLASPFVKKPARKVRVNYTTSRDGQQSNIGTSMRGSDQRLLIQRQIELGTPVETMETWGGAVIQSALLEIIRGNRPEDPFHNLRQQTKVIRDKLKEVLLPDGTNIYNISQEDLKKILGRYAVSKDRRILSVEELSDILSNYRISGSDKKEIIRRYNLKQEMLLRGQYIVGLEPYPDEVLKMFIEVAYEMGDDIFRIFDALNDSRNILPAIGYARDTHAFTQPVLHYSSVFPQGIPGYVKLAKAYVAAAKNSLDALTIKDAAGLLEPDRVFALVRALRNSGQTVPFEVHTHDTNGNRQLVLLEAIRANGSEAPITVDVAIGKNMLSAPFAQPDALDFFTLTQGTAWQVEGADAAVMQRIRALEDFIRTEIMPKYKKPLYASTYDRRQFVRAHLPGGMKSNFIDRQIMDNFSNKTVKNADGTTQVIRGLAETVVLPQFNIKMFNSQGILTEDGQRFIAALMNVVYDEMIQVRVDAGDIGLVTPTSQWVGVQAFNNVMDWVTKGYLDYSAAKGQLTRSEKFPADRAKQYKSEKPIGSLQNYYVLWAQDLYLQGRAPAPEEIGGGFWPGYEKADRQLVFKSVEAVLKNIPDEKERAAAIYVARQAIITPGPVKTEDVKKALGYFEPVRLALRKPFVDLTVVEVMKILRQEAAKENNQALAAALKSGKLARPLVLKAISSSKGLNIPMDRAELLQAYGNISPTDLLNRALFPVQIANLMRQRAIWERKFDTLLSEEHRNTIIIILRKLGVEEERLAFLEIRTLRYYRTLRSRIQSSAGSTAIDPDVAKFVGWYITNREQQDLDSDATASYLMDAIRNDTPSLPIDVKKQIADLLAKISPMELKQIKYVQMDARLFRVAQVLSPDPASYKANGESPAENTITNVSEFLTGLHRLFSWIAETKGHKYYRFDVANGLKSSKSYKITVENDTLNIVTVEPEGSRLSIEDRPSVIYSIYNPKYEEMPTGSLTDLRIETTLKTKSGRYVAEVKLYRLMPTNSSLVTTHNELASTTVPVSRFIVEKNVRHFEIIVASLISKIVQEVYLANPEALAKDLLKISGPKFMNDISESGIFAKASKLLDIVGSGEDASVKKSLILNETKDLSSEDAMKLLDIIAQPATVKEYTFLVDTLLEKAGYKDIEKKKGSRLAEITEVTYPVRKTGYDVGLKVVVSRVANQAKIVLTEHDRQLVGMMVSVKPEVWNTQNALGLMASNAHTILERVVSEQPKLTNKAILSAAIPQLQDPKSGITAGILLPGPGARLASQKPQLSLSRQEVINQLKQNIHLSAEEKAMLDTNPDAALTAAIDRLTNDKDELKAEGTAYDEARSLKDWIIGDLTRDQVNLRAATSAQRSFIPLNVPETLSPLLRSEAGLIPVSAEVAVLRGEESDAKALFNDQDIVHAVSATESASIYILPLNGVVKGKEKDYGDGNAVHAVDNNNILFVKANPGKIAIINEANEGKRDGSYNIRDGRIYYYNPAEPEYVNGYRDFSNAEGTEFDREAFNAEVARLEKSGVEIRRQKADSLERTVGITKEEGAFVPEDKMGDLETLIQFGTDSNSFMSIGIGKPRVLIDDNTRVWGAAYNGKELLPLALFGGLLDFYQKKAHSRGINPETDTEGFKKFMSHQAFFSIGPRPADQQKAGDGGSEIDKNRHGYLIKEAYQLQQLFPGFRAITSGDGNFFPAAIALSGLELEGYEFTVINRYGSTEGHTLSDIAANIPTAQFPHRDVSNSATSKKFEPENVGVYSNDERDIYTKLGTTAEAESHVRSKADLDARKGQAVVAVSAVTGASVDKYGKTFARLFHRPLVAKDANGGAKITVNTLVFSRTGGVHLVRVTYETNDYAATIEKIKSSSEASRAFFKKQNATTGARLALEKSLAPSVRQPAATQALEKPAPAPASELSTNLVSQFLAEVAASATPFLTTASAQIAVADVPRQGELSVFTLERHGDTTVATSGAFPEPFTFNDKDRQNLKKTDASLKADSNRVLDAVMLRNQVRASITSDLDQVVTDSTKTVLVDIHLDDIMPVNQKERYVESFIRDLVYVMNGIDGENAYYRIIASKQTSDFLFNSAAQVLSPQELAKFKEVVRKEGDDLEIFKNAQSVRFATQAHYGRDLSRNFLVQKLEASEDMSGMADVPLFDIELRMAVKAGRIDPDNVPAPYVMAWSKLSGVKDVTGTIIGQMFKGVLAVLEAARYALKPILRETLDVAMRVFQMARKQLEQAA